MILKATLNLSRNIFSGIILRRMAEMRRVYFFEYNPRKLAHSSSLLAYLFPGGTCQKVAL